MPFLHRWSVCDFLINAEKCLSKYNYLNLALATRLLCFSFCGLPSCACCWAGSPTWSLGSLPHQGFLFHPGAKTGLSHAMNTWAHPNTSVTSRSASSSGEGSSFLVGCCEHKAPLPAAAHRSHRQLGLACEAVGGSWNLRTAHTSAFTGLWVKRQLWATKMESLVSPTTPPMTAPATGRAASLYFAACKDKEEKKELGYLPVVMCLFPFALGNELNAQQ